MSENTYDLECDFCNTVIEIVVPCGGELGTIQDGVCGECVAKGHSVC